MPRVYKVQKARKDYEGFGIKKGDTYFWWKFRFGPKMMSKIPPTRSQLTQSSFLSQIYELEDKFVFDREDPQSCIDELVSELSSLSDECQGSLDNMPDQLREGSSSGELLQQRIDSLDEWISNLESIETTVDLETDEDEIEAQIDRIEQEIQDANPGID